MLKNMMMIILITIPGFIFCSTTDIYTVQTDKVEMWDSVKSTNKEGTSKDLNEGYRASDHDPIESLRDGEIDIPEVLNDSKPELAGYVGEWENAGHTNGIDNFPEATVDVIDVTEHGLVPSDGNDDFSLNYNGNKIIISGGLIGGYLRIKDIELDTMHELEKGINPFISPDGEKIFFTKGVSASENIE